MLDKYLSNIIRMFLPPLAKIIVLEIPFKRPAVGMIDIDRDGILELIGAYNWQGENYIIVLKYDCVGWRLIDITKVNDINEENYWYLPTEELMGLRRQLCEYKPFSNQVGIDFSTIEYICSETQRDIKLEKALIKEFELDRYQDSVRYYYNRVDINNDGKLEVFVYLVGPLVCGTGGCSAVIFKQEDEEYITLARFSLVNNPVIISNSKTNGFRDIIMHVYGGGIESFFALIKYNGKTYPSNPSIQPKVEPGTKVGGIAIVVDDISKHPGIKLETLNKMGF